MKNDIVLDLYRAAELLQRSYLALDLAGNAEAAKHCREAACDVVHAISAVVKERAEREGVVS